MAGVEAIRTREGMATVIVGLVSSYREGELVAGAIRTAASACELVLVLEGPIGGGVDLASTRASRLRPSPHVLVREEVEPFESDAAKRTELLRWAQSIHAAKISAGRARTDEPLWVVWVDGDELLLWGEWLGDYIARAIEEGDGENATGGFPLRLVEADGSVHLSWGRVVNGLAVRRYLTAAYEAELVSGLVVAMPLTPSCTAGGVPLMPAEWQAPPASPEERDLWLAQYRPPLAGEPHILHRHTLRGRVRSGLRGKDLEAAAFEEIRP